MSSPPPPTAPKVATPPVERVLATMSRNDARARRAGPIAAIVAGVLVIVGALGSLLIDRNADGEVLTLAAAFECPPGVEARSGKVKVTAKTLNVRSGPSAKSDRLSDRTLRKNEAVTEECRTDSWSRVRLLDGRSGWVANQYLQPLAQKN